MLPQDPVEVAVFRTKTLLQLEHLQLFVLPPLRLPDKQAAGNLTSDNRLVGAPRHTRSALPTSRLSEALAQRAAQMACAAGRRWSIERERVNSARRLDWRAVPRDRWETINYRPRHPDIDIVGDLESI